MIADLFEHVIQEMKARSNARRSEHVQIHPDTYLRLPCLSEYRSCAVSWRYGAAMPYNGSSENFKQPVILFRRTYGDSQTSAAIICGRSVPDDDSGLNKLRKRLVLVPETDQEEIRIRRIYFLHFRQYRQCFRYPLPFSYEFFHPVRSRKRVRKDFRSLLLIKDADIVRILHPGHDIHDIAVRYSHTYSQTGHTPCFRQCLQYNQPWISVQKFSKTTASGEVDIGFVDDRNAAESIQNPDNGIPIEKIPGWIVRRTQEYQSGIGPDSGQKIIGIEREIRRQRSIDDIDIVDGGGYRIHSVSRHSLDHTAIARRAEKSEYQIYGLVASVPEKNIRRRYFPDGGQHPLQLRLVGRRITVYS